MAAQVILQMNVHCNGCARKISRTAKNVHGVEGVWTSPETEALRSRIEYATRRPVTVVSGGAEQAPDNRRRSSHLLASPHDTWWTTYSAPSLHAVPLEAPDHWWMTPSRYTPPPRGYPPYAGMRRLPPPPHYAPHPQPVYPYDNGSWHDKRWVPM